MLFIVPAQGGTNRSAETFGTSFHETMCAKSCLILAHRFMKGCAKHFSEITHRLTVLQVAIHHTSFQKMVPFSHRFDKIR